MATKQIEKLYSAWKESGKTPPDSKKVLVQYLRNQIRAKKVYVKTLKDALANFEKEILNLNQDIAFIEDELLLPATNKIRKKK